MKPNIHLPNPIVYLSLFWDENVGDGSKLTEVIFYISSANARCYVADVNSTTQALAAGRIDDVVEPCGL